MKLTTLLALAATTAVAASCGNDDAQKPVNGRVITQNDFESTAGWGVDPAALSREQAHSGVYSITVNPTHEFSLTYEAALGQISPQKFKKIHLEAWAYLQSQKGNASLGVQFTDPAQGNKAIGGEGIDLGQAVKQYNKWVLVSKDFVLPDNVTSANHLKVFVWRAMASQPVFIDDIRLTIPE